MICRRGDPAEAAKRTSSDWPIVMMLAFVGVLIAVSGGYWLTRRISDLMAAKPIPTSVTLAPTASAEPPPIDDRNPFANDPKPYMDDPPPPPPPTTAVPGLTQERLDQLKRKVKVTMFMTPKCTMCTRARLFMNKQRYNFSELDIESSETDKVLLTSLNPAGTVPTFDVEGKILVGFDSLALDAAIENKVAEKLKR